jgi:hypothetical protein
MTAGAVALLATTAVPASASSTPSPAAYKALGPKVEAARLKTAFPADSFTCHDQEYLNSSANADYVSAELGYNGADYAMLRSRASTAGPWEKYTNTDLCP